MRAAFLRHHACSGRDYRSMHVPTVPTNDQRGPDVKEPSLETVRIRCDLDEAALMPRRPRFPTGVAQVEGLGF